MYNKKSSKCTALKQWNNKKGISNDFAFDTRFTAISCSLLFIYLNVLSGVFIRCCSLHSLCTALNSSFSLFSRINFQTIPCTVCCAENCVVWSNCCCCLFLFAINTHTHTLYIHTIYIIFCTAHFKIDWSLLRARTRERNAEVHAVLYRPFPF